MKICLLTDGITPFVTGGMQRHSFNLCNELLKLGNHVTLVHCIYGNSDIPKKTEVNGLFSNSENLRAISLRFPNSSGLPGHYIKESYQYSCAVTNALRDSLSDFDVIYIKGFTGWNLLQLRKKGEIQTGPTILNFHGLEMFQPPASLAEGLKSFLLRSPVKWNLNQADYCVSYGGKITTILEKIGVSKSRILAIPGAVNDDILLYQKTHPVNSKFLFVGRYERRKGIEELINVAKQLPDLNLSFVGNIPYSKRFFRENIAYYGEVKDVRELNKIYDEHTFLICPSHSEGMPNVILEAMSRGLIPIGTRVGAVEELINDKNGFLIDTKNENELKLVLEKALELEKINKIDLSQQALLTIKNHFTWSKIVQYTTEKFQQMT